MLVICLVPFAGKKTCCPAGSRCRLLPCVFFKLCTQHQGCRAAASLACCSQRASEQQSQLVMSLSSNPNLTHSAQRGDGTALEGGKKG